MAKAVLTITDWSGGIAPDLKQGFRGSFGYGRGLDYRRTPSTLKLAPKLVKNSGSTVTDLVLNAVMTNQGDLFFIGATGNFYKKSAAGTWSLVADLGATASGGMMYRADVDEILIAEATTVTRYFPVSSSPAIQGDKYGPSIDQEDTTGSNTYALTTGVSESAADLLSYTPDIEPTYSVMLYVVAKGTGDWTLTLHDDANRELGAVTIANAALTNGQYNEFIFSSQVRLLVSPNARTYHVHVHSTVADGTVQTGTASDFSTANYKVYADRLINTANGKHPMMQFEHLTCIGNGEYLSTFEPLYEDESSVSIAVQKANWQRHRLQFEPGFEVCALGKVQEYLAIGCQKTNSGGNGSYQSGVIYYWDGLSSTINFKTHLPEGSPLALSGDKDNLHFITEDGELYGVPGAGAQPQKLRRFPNTDPEYTDAYADIQINPDMITVRRGVLLVGFPSTTASLAIEHGVYSLGALDRNYADSFNFDHVISTGVYVKDADNDLSIGMVKNFGDELYVSWRDDDNGAYGVDMASPNSDPSPSGSFESMLYDFDTPWKDKLALRLRINFKALPTGATITPKYKINRGSWVTGTAATAGETDQIFSFNKRFREIQVGFDYVATTTEIEVISVALEYDDLKAEAAF